MVKSIQVSVCKFDGECLFPIVLQQAGRNPSKKVLAKYWKADTGDTNLDFGIIGIECCMFVMD